MEKVESYELRVEGESFKPAGFGRRDRPTTAERSSAGKRDCKFAALTPGLSPASGRGEE
jgi:hypothetical protein